MRITIDATEWNADAMREVYQRMADARVRMIEQGKYPGIQEGRYRLTELLELEKLGATPLESVRNREGATNAFVPEQIAGSPLRQLRQQVLSGMVYQGLASLDERVQATLERVDDPVLNHFLPLFKKEGKDAALKAFQSSLIDLDTDNHFMEVLWYVRTLAFLEIARRHPDKSSRFDENSSYFPQRMFYEPRQERVWEQLEAEIADAFLSIFPESIADTVAGIERHIIPSEHTQVNHSRGRFRIPFNIRLQFSPDAKDDEINACYNTTDIKRAVYETLHHYLRLSSKLSNEAGVRVKELKTKGGYQLGLSNKEYKEVKRNIANYACNQILNVWLADDVIPAPRLAGWLGLRATSDGKTLTIVDPSPHRGTQRFTKESKSFDTTVYLPFCVAMLNRVYQAAREIQAEELQRQETAETTSTAP